MRGLCRILLFALLLHGAASALYQGSAVTAFRVDNGQITVDGKPDEGAWKEIAVRHGGAIQLPFNDYERIVLLEAAAIRNADPRLHYSAPSSGSVSLIAAYDAQNLYFLFLVRENDLFNPDGLCTAADLWRAHAADLFLDTTAWNPDLVPAIFSADAQGLTNGTSRSTLQLAKPAHPGDARLYYRDRSQNNRFEIRATPAALKAVASARPGDSLNVAVEMSIPYSQAVNPVGKSMFVSWGYNHYPSGDRSACGRNPIAYRWAKHYKTYGDGDVKPPNWRAGDSTHFDPTRSWDGWGELRLSQTKPAPTNCTPGNSIPWDPRSWIGHCSLPTDLAPMVSRKAGRAILLPDLEAAARDLLGRRAAPGAPVLRMLPLP